MSFGGLFGSIGEINVQKICCLIKHTQPLYVYSKNRHLSLVTVFIFLNRVMQFLSNPVSRCPNTRPCELAPPDPTFSLFNIPCRENQTTPIDCLAVRVVSRSCLDILLCQSLSRNQKNVFQAHSQPEMAAQHVVLPATIDSWWGGLGAGICG